MGSTHALAGLLLWFSFEKAGLSAPLGIIAFVLGALLPDIDHPNGTIRQLAELPDFLARPVAEIIPHRGPTHTIWGAIGFSILTIGLLLGSGIFAATVTGLALFLGYVSHLVLDSLNPTGVDWLKPWEGVHLGWEIRTGSTGERYFFYGLWGLFVAIAVL